MQCAAGWHSQDRTSYTHLFFSTFGLSILYLQLKYLDLSKVYLTISPWKVPPSGNFSSTIVGILVMVGLQVDYYYTTGRGSTSHSALPCHCCCSQHCPLCCRCAPCRVAPISGKAMMILSEFLPQITGELTCSTTSHTISAKWVRSCSKSALMGAALLHL